MSEEQAKTSIKIPTEGYTVSKSASGATTRHNGDTVANALQGLTIQEVYKLTAEAMEVEVSELEERYKHLNVGQQRMNLGNRLRGVVGKMNRACEKAEAADEELPHVTGDVYISELAEPYRAAVQEREEAEAQAKAEREAEREAKRKEKEAKAKEPVAESDDE